MKKILVAIMIFFLIAVSCYSMNIMEKPLARERGPTLENMDSVTELITEFINGIYIPEMNKQLPSEVDQDVFPFRQSCLKPNPCVDTRLFITATFHDCIFNQIHNKDDLRCVTTNKIYIVQKETRNLMLMITKSKIG